METFEPKLSPNEAGSTEPIISPESQERLLKPATLEVLKNDKVLLKKVCDQIAEINIVGGSEIIDFGPGFEKTDKTTLTYYVGYQIGLPQEIWGNNSEPIERYLQLYLEDPTKADDYLTTKIEGQKEKNFLIESSKKLSTIIPGAPEIVQAKLIVREGDVRPRLSSQDTSKVQDLIVAPNEKGKEILKQAFEGRTLIDLACGSEARGLDIANAFHSKAYIGVDPFNAERSLSTIVFKHNEKETLGDIHIARADMLTFLRHMPSDLENVVFLISGVDQWIISEGNPSDDDETREQERAVRIAAEHYWYDLYSELERVMGNGSRLVVYASMNPAFVPYYLSEEKDRLGPEKYAQQYTKTGHGFKEIAVLKELGHTAETPIEIFAKKD